MKLLKLTSNGGVRFDMLELIVLGCYIYLGLVFIDQEIDFQNNRAGMHLRLILYQNPYNS